MSNNLEENKAAGSKRRRQTKGEKEALRLRRLRQEFSSSPIDPDEPALPEGFPLIALRCAFKDARQLHTKPKGRFAPESIVLRTNSIFQLSTVQQEAIEAWLYWLKDRKWVSRDPYVSPLLQWLFSGAPGNATWCGDPNGIWRDKVDYEHAERLASVVASAPVDMEASHAPDGEAAARARRAPQSKAYPTELAVSPVQAQEALQPSSSIGAAVTQPADGKIRETHVVTAQTKSRADVQTRMLNDKENSADSLISHTGFTPAGEGADNPTAQSNEARTKSGSAPNGVLSRPVAPETLFRGGQKLANSFFEAFSEMGDADLERASITLSQDSDATRAAMSGCVQAKVCIVQIFNQLGLPLPETNP